MRASAAYFCNYSEFLAALTRRRRRTVHVKNGRYQMQYHTAQKHSSFGALPLLSPPGVLSRAHTRVIFFSVRGIINPASARKTRRPSAHEQQHKRRTWQPRIFYDSLGGVTCLGRRYVATSTLSSSVCWCYLIVVSRSGDSSNIDVDDAFFLFFTVSLSLSLPSHNLISTLTGR